jgi:maleylpyruvate isomerase
MTSSATEGAAVSETAGPYSVPEMISRIDESVDRVLRSASGLSERQLGEPSLLPGWSRGHVLTHIARNADGLRNLLIWAKTGEQTPQYASVEAREQDIETGAGRNGEELTADIASSGLAFTELAAELPDDAWQASVQMIRGEVIPASSVLSLRLFELEVHHVDLGAGYRAADWPDWFVSDELYRVSGRLAHDPDAPSAVLNDPQTGRQYFVRADGSSALAITGPGYDLLAWLLGRSGGNELSTEPAGPLPAVPAY